MNPIVGTQSYCWHQIYDAQGKKLSECLDEVLGYVAWAGIEAWEGGVASAQEAESLGKLLRKHALKMPSMYSGGALHAANWKEAVDRIVQQGRWAKPLGVSVMVVNPDPLNWASKQNKSDDQLKTQAEAMQALGEKLSAEGIALAYHTHDPEMRASAREFHHMMCGTDPKHVGLCLDAHWIYRGAENSQVALYDIVKLYGARIGSLHIRQSQDGVWTEVLGDGDIDYRPLAAYLKQTNFAGPLVIEQCFEKGTPQTLSGPERQKRCREWVKGMFGA